MNTADNEMFKILGSSGTGKQLVSYLKRMQDRICDSRNWKQGETKESSNQAARYLDEVISKIQVLSPMGIAENNQSE